MVEVPWEIHEFERLSGASHPIYVHIWTVLLEYLEIGEYPFILVLIDNSVLYKLVSEFCILDFKSFISLYAIILVKSSDKLAATFT